MPLKNSIKPVVGNKEPVASVSSLDQSAISAVDLAIATSVEKEAADSINQTENKPDTMDENARMKQSKGAGGNTRSPAAAVSVLDHVGVSSVDLDMTASVEKGLGSLEPSSMAETSAEASEPKGNGICISVKVIVCESVYIFARTKGTECILKKKMHRVVGF